MTSPIQLHHGDCLDVLGRMAERGALVHAAVTDPPYHLTSIVKRFGGKSAAAAKPGEADHHTGAFARSSKGFMGQEWDGGDIAFRPETWAMVRDVLHPGGHLIAFNHSRTFHRMVCAIEDAGFEIRDSLMWIYGSGFPKSHDVAKGVEKLGEDPADWQGWGTALKPAFEPIVLARKPLSEKSIARQCLATGTGGLNIDASRTPSDGKKTHSNPRAAANGWGAAPSRELHADRWPANVIHDGSTEATAGMPADLVDPLDPAKGAQSYFFCAKADKADRRGSDHPTVKPQSLMRWLVRMVSAEGQTILDPFAGSGSTGWAAATEGRRAVLIERDDTFVAHIDALIHRRADWPAAPAKSRDDRQPPLI